MASPPPNVVTGVGRVRLEATWEQVMGVDPSQANKSFEGPSFGRSTHPSLCEFRKLIEWTATGTSLSGWRTADFGEE